MTFTHIAAVRSAQRAWSREKAEAARIKRERSGLTQTDVARLMRVHPSAVNRWEAGTRRPAAAVLLRYVRLIERLEATAS